MTAHYLDPKNDLTFKRVFGEHKHLCKRLLNNLLPLNESQQIGDMEYQRGELVPEIEVLCNSIVDVRCTDVCDRQFIVEMQMYRSESFESRVLLNASKAYVMQLDIAGKYELLQPVYSLSLVNDTFEKTPEMRDARREGEAIGLEKGRKEFAVACLKKGLSSEDVKDLTGLEMDEILALQEINRKQP